MKEQRLIRALVRDLQPARPLLPANVQVGLGLLWTLAVVTLFTRGGAAISGTPAWLPVVVCAVLLVTAGIAAVVSSVPGRSAWRIAAIAAVTGVLAWTLETASRLGAAAAVDPWGEIPWIKCMGFSIGVAAVASAGLVYLLRRGWPLRPRLTAAFTMGWGASAAALTTTLECGSNAPMHVLLGHLLPLLMLSALGALLAPRFFTPAVEAGHEGLRRL